MDTLLPCERDFVKKSGLTRGITVKLGDKELFGTLELFLNAKCSLSL